VATNDLSVEEFARWRAEGKSFVLLDVRTPAELMRAALPDAVNVPLQDLPARIGELDRDAEIAVLCHSGHRSAYAVAFLASHGFANVHNVSGGIDAYARTVDLTIPRY
jgi:rhodanese-related sulfurtransferase